jgi:hypothetical protein
VRDRARRELRNAGRGWRRRLDARLGNRPDELADEERDAAGHLVASGRERRLHIGPQPQPHQLGHRSLSQWREHEDLGRRVGSERRKKRRAVRRLDGPCRGDDRERQFVQSSPEVVQKAQRGLVSPVNIVDGQQERGAPSQVRTQPVKPVQNGE